MYYIMDKNNSLLWDRSRFPKRPQTSYGKQVQILDASDEYFESQSFHAPDINVINSEWLFGSDEIVLGIGKPNVFTLLPDGEWEHVRFAAKSLKRAPSILEETKNRVQSSIFIILKWLSDTEIESIHESASLNQWSREVTCVKANMKMLDQAWITLWNWETLDKILFPGQCFKAIVDHGLSMNGQEIDIDLLKTSKKYLESQVFQTKKSVLLTPWRHLNRFLVKKWIFKRKSIDKNKSEDTSYPQAPYMEHADHHMDDITLFAADTPRISRHLRRFWWAHGIIWIKQDRIDINEYLDEKLEAYDQKKPTFATKIKRDYLFNRHVVRLLNFFLQKGYTEFADKTESDIHTLFETDSEVKSCKYNIVATEEWSRLMKVSVNNKKIDWVLTKHVLVSNYDENVRFAWEAWKDSEWIIWINRNSWTYAPSEKQLDQFIQYIGDIFPNVIFKADYNL